MNKEIVIGCPGSGKSTFSRALHELTDLPLYHLDLLNWNSLASGIWHLATKKELEKSGFSLDKGGVFC